MAGPEALQALAEALIKLSEAAKGATAPGRVAGKEAAASRQAKSLSEQAKEWSEKVMSKDKKVREEAKQKENEKKSPNKYNNDPNKLGNAQNRLTNVQEHNTDNTPDDLEKDPAQINSTAIAEFTATLTQINKIPKEHRDPHVIYEEVGKLYRSIDWVNATPTQKTEARRAINAGLKFVKETALARETQGSYFAEQIREDKSKVDYRLNLGISNEEHFDLYRSRQADTTADPARPNRQGRVTGESGGTKLDRLLKTTQNRLDGVTTLEAEVDALRHARDQIIRGLEMGTYSEGTAGEYADLINSRLEDLKATIDAERAASSPSGRRGRVETPGMAQTSKRIESDEQNKHLENVPPEFHAAVKKIFALQNIENPTLKDIREAKVLLFNTFRGGIDAESVSNTHALINAFIKNKATDSSDAAFNIERNKFFKAREVLENIIGDRERPLVEDYGGYARAYFGRHPEHFKFLNELNFNGRTLVDLTLVERKELTNMAQGIIDRMEDNPRANFREGVDLYTGDNWKEFISILRDKATQANWKPGEIDQLSNYFTGIREMRDLVHDLELVSNFAGLELLQKFTQNTLAGDLDAWITYTPGMRFALSVYHEQLRYLQSQHGGHLPPEFVDITMTKETHIDRMVMRQLEEAVKSGRIEELKIINEKYHAGLEMIRNGDDKGADLIAEARREMDRARKVAKAFGTLTLRTTTVLSESKLPYVFGSLPKNNAVQDQDWFRHGMVKYGVGKDARAQLWIGLTGDKEGANRLRTMSDHEAETFFYEMENHPKFGYAIAELRNYARMADRFGDGKSFWGMVLGMKDWPQEMRDLRGVGAKLFDAAARAEREIKAVEVAAKFGTGNLDGRRAEIEQWWLSRAHEHDVHHRIDTLYKQKMQAAYNELRYKLPGEFINRSSLDVGYERLNFDALEMTLRTTDPHLLKRILKNEDGSDFIITRGGKNITIKSLWDLYYENPHNRPTDMDVGIPKVMQDDMNRRQGLMEAYAYQVKQDLGILQQVNMDAYWRYADGDIVNGIEFDESHMKAGMLNRHLASTFQSSGELIDQKGTKYGVISAEQRQNMARTYIAAIDHVTGQPLKTTWQGKELIRPSYKDYLFDRFIKGWESNIFTDTDIRLDRINYANWGGSVISRTIGDAKNNSDAMKGFWTISEGLTGHPNWEKVSAELSEKVGAPMAMADPVLAKNIEGFFWHYVFNLYAADPRMSNLGLAGHVLTSEFMIETWEKIFGRDKVPDWMWGSYSKKFGDPGNEILMADDIWRISRMASENGQLPQKHHPLGWAQSIYSPTSYTKEALRTKYGGNVINIVPQAIMTIIPIGFGLTLYQAITEKDEEHR